MSMNEMNDFLYHLKKYMEYTTEMRDTYERLSDYEKEVVKKAHPLSQSPETISKQAYKWHDAIYKATDTPR
ncbi:hypothetical protein [Thalassobacillus hwangdonensis]|uniref:Uncharacterized protein n=1 Tax=Thalassobacillus hwangdonensis TaxID=546108 RepID=A0ABW3KXX2_9BACI